MSLKSTILEAVQRIRIAFGDLIVTSTLTRRVKNPYVPGTPVNYTSQDFSVDFVPAKEVSSEEEGERVDDDEVTLYIFPLSVIPQPNDVVSFNGRDYRIVDNKPIYAGNEIALSVVRVKPGGQV